MKAFWERLDTLSPAAWRILRFGAVGVVATGVYLALAMALPYLSGLALSPTLSALIASVCSVAVSYVGHHRITFLKQGDHKVYLPRFLLISALLSLMAAAGTFILTREFGIDHRVVAILVAVLYPVASYLLNLLWVFET